MAWPNLFLVGAEKAGTTSLHAILDRHPEVTMCQPKEPHHYAWKLDRVARGNLDADAARTDYAACFADGRWRGDASTSSLWHPQAAQRIQVDVPDARILASLRDPVERAFSHYLMAVRSGREHRPFRDAVEADLRREASGQAPVRYVVSSRYGSQWRRYIETFGPASCHVVWFEQLVRDTEAAMRPVAKLLGLEPGGFGSEQGTPKANPYWGPRNAMARGLVTSRGLRRVAKHIMPGRLRSFIGDRILMGRTRKPVLQQATGRWLAGILEDEVDVLFELAGRPPMAWRWFA